MEQILVENFNYSLASKHHPTENSASRHQTLTLVTTFFATLLLFLYFLKQRFTRKTKNCEDVVDKDHVFSVNDIPGPVEYFPKLIGSFPSLWPHTKSIETGMRWAAQFPGMVRITGANRTFVGLHSGPVVQQFLKSTDYGHGEKAPVMYDLMKPFISNGVLVSSGKFWQGQRKVLMKCQSFQSLKGYMGMLNKHSENFVKKLETLFEDGKTHQINHTINVVFLKIINEMITGDEVKSSEEFGRYHHNFNIWKEALIHRLLNPLFLPGPIWRLHPMSGRQDDAVKEMFEFARRRVREHQEKRNGNTQDLNKSLDRNVLDDLLEAGNDENQIVDEVNTMIFGGHETGATAIHFFCLCMALNPDIQNLCQKEVDEQFEMLEGPLSYESVQSNFKYLERCILETLRLYPPVFMFLREIKSPIILTNDDKKYLLPAGTNIVFGPYGQHRNPKDFPNPDVFDPERFLPGEISKRHAYSFIPFSAGPRNCLGQKFAMIELKIIACYLLRNFEMSTTDKLKDIPLLPFVTLTPGRDYMFQFKKRNHENKI